MKRFGIACLLLVAALGLAQEAREEPQAKELSIKRSMIINKVVVVMGQQGKTAVQLQCNEGLTSCAALDAGAYLMVELPKNRGIYECDNVRVYAKTANPANDAPVGEYCLVQPGKE